jgi:hypothetical protein
MLFILSLFDQDDDDDDDDDHLAPYFGTVVIPTTSVGNSSVEHSA